MSGMKFKGRAHVYGRDVDTDVIIPARYLNTTDPDELAGHCMMDIDSGFVDRVEPGDIIIAGDNFGCGSSREQAPVAIKAAGVACVVASSFARIFFRNAINIGLPILVCPGAAEGITTGDEVSVDLESGEVVDLASGRTFRAEGFPEFMQEIVAAGGLMNHVKARIKG